MDAKVNPKSLIRIPLQKKPPSHATNSEKPKPTTKEDFGGDIEKSAIIKAECEEEESVIKEGNAENLKTKVQHKIIEEDESDELATAIAPTAKDRLKVTSGVAGKSEKSLSPAIQLFAPTHTLTDTIKEEEISLDSRNAVSSHKIDSGDFARAEWQSDSKLNSSNTGSPTTTSKRRTRQLKSSPSRLQKSQPTRQKSPLRTSPLQSLDRNQSKVIETNSGSGCSGSDEAKNIDRSKPNHRKALSEITEVIFVLKILLNLLILIFIKILIIGGDK